MNLQKISLIFSALLVLMACASLVVAQETGEPDTHEVFGRYASRIVKIHVVENSSGAKATIGSGFHVSKAGHIITNYHVISKIVHHGDRYSAEFIDSGGGSHPLKILNIDVINDLAVVQSDYLAKDYFNLSVIDI
ncbi:trypsin-like peptidase domain-containing protein, partial [bacterium]|nr:trypsin-like peptidase domain-containing protein [bacterium]